MNYANDMLLNFQLNNLHFKLRHKFILLVCEMFFSEKTNYILSDEKSKRR